MSNKKIAILGAGMQGTACGYDLSKLPDIAEVCFADVDVNRASVSAQRVRDLNPKANITTQALNVENQQELIQFLTPYDVVVSAVPYFLNLKVTEAAIASGTHMVDMGGNTDLVWEQRKRHDQALAKGVTILPDAGLAPGMANILAAHAISQLDEVEEVHIRVGGLPQSPKPPLNYQMFFSMHGLINEYIGESVILKNGKIEKVSTLTDLESLSFKDPAGEFEAFHTLGGISTLPWTYEGKIKTMDYKTIRYVGHCHQIKTMADLGFFEEQAIEVKNREGQISQVIPRDFFAALVTPRLTFEENRDLVLVRITVIGAKAGEPLKHTYEIVDRFDAKTGFTAMMRTTAYPVAILAQMLANGDIAERGVLPLETGVPTGKFVNYLNERGIALKVDALPLKEEAHCH
jgi:lysine 6-dehydrogenase